MLVSLAVQIAIVVGIVVLAVRPFDLDLGLGGSDETERLGARVADFERQVEELRREDE